MACPFFEMLDRTELDEIVAKSVERRVPKHTTIFQKGDAGSHLMAVLVGRVSITSVSPEGKEIKLRELGPGDVFGEIALLDGKARTANAVAVTDSTLVLVERAIFMPLLRNEEMLQRLLNILCDRLRRTTVALEEAMLYDVPARLARLLSRLAEEYGQRQADGSIRIGMSLSHRELGESIGTARETVCKKIRDFELLNLVTQEGRFVTIPNDEALRSLRDLGSVVRASRDPARSGPARRKQPVLVS